MIDKKCQPKFGLKVYGPISMDMFKTTCPKWLRGFFDTCLKWVFYLPKFIVKTSRNSSSDPFGHKGVNLGSTTSA
jgi:hypothetical protein